MIKEVFFFDSYAIVEIIKGSENYLKYANAIIIITKLNLFEVYYGILRESTECDADKFLVEYKKYVIGYDENVIREAARLKLEYRKRNVSMTDCIGYCIAQKWGVKFLTGDKEFEKMENVEFVK
ncbi:MAG: PIN domain-containing protein [Nanoarchaeota archaeon]